MVLGIGIEPLDPTVEPLQAAQAEPGYGNDFQRGEDFRDERHRRGVFSKQEQDRRQQACQDGGQEPERIAPGNSVLFC